jgi:hypothetical protein
LYQPPHVQQQLILIEALHWLLELRICLYPA